MKKNEVVEFLLSQVSEAKKEYMMSGDFPDLGLIANKDELVKRVNILEYLFELVKAAPREEFDDDLPF